MAKRTAQIIAKIEAEISLRELTGQPDFVPGLKAAIALIDAEYYREHYLNQGPGKKPEVRYVAT